MFSSGGHKLKPVQSKKRGASSRDLVKLPGAKVRVLRNFKRCRKIIELYHKLSAMKNAVHERTIEGNFLVTFN